MDGCSEGVEMDALVSLLALIVMVVRCGSSRSRKQVDLRVSDGLIKPFLHCSMYPDPG
jgi:hypothetical protein